MHPLEGLNDAELGSLARVVDRLLNSRHLLAPGQRINSRRAGIGIEFLDHREYCPGDDIRSVDWRVSARSRHPQIRRYCDEAAADWFILLDCSSSMAIGGATKWALALQCAAAMAYLLLHLGNRVAILAFSDRIESKQPPGRGYAHYARSLRGLRRTETTTCPGGSNPGCCVAGIRRNSPVFVISDFLAADGMREGLEALSRRADRLHALQILSKADRLLPPGRSASLEDVETGAIVSADIGSLQREEYHRAFDGYNHALAQYCRNRHIHFSRHDDTETWKSAIMAHLRYGGKPR